MSDEQTKNAALSLADQVWAHMREFNADIQRIARGGVDTANDRDLNIIRMVFSAVAGDLIMRSQE